MILLFLTGLLCFFGIGDCQEDVIDEYTTWDEPFPPLTNSNYTNSSPSWTQNSTSYDEERHSINIVKESKG